MQVVRFHDPQDGKGGHHSGLPLQVGHREIADLACHLQILKGYGQGFRFLNPSDAEGLAAGCNQGATTGF